MLCDGKRDCPDGEDENSCDSLVCPGLLLCRFDHLCVHPTNICDGIVHCLFSRDDEKHCRSWECPAGCVCLAFMVQCFTVPAQFHYNINILVLQYADIPERTTLSSMTGLIHVDLSSTIISNGHVNCFLLWKLRQLRTLKLRNCSITKIAQCAFEDLTNVVSLDLLLNHINALESNTLNNFNMLTTLQLSNITLFQIRPYAFIGLPYVETLNLSFNMLTHLYESMFYGMSNLYVLDIRYNSIVLIEEHTFFYMSANLQVRCSSSVMCCHIRTTQVCMIDTGAIRGGFRCGKIFVDRKFAQNNLYISSLFLIVIIVSVISQRFAVKHRIQIILTRHLAIVDACLILYIMGASSMSLWYEHHAIFIATYWLNTTFCYTLAVMVVCGLFLSKVTTLCVSLNHLSVTKYALRMIHVPVTHVMYVLGISWLIVVLTTWFLVRPTHASCYPLVRSSQDSPFQMLLTSVFAFVSLAITLAVILIYKTIIQFVTSQSHQTKSTVNRQKIHRQLIQHAIGVTSVEITTDISLLVMSLHPLVLTMNTNLYIIVTCLYINAIIHHINYVRVHLIRKIQSRT